jgi:hypothetical protein
MAKDNTMKISQSVFQDMVRRIQDLERDTAALERASVRQDGQLGKLDETTELHTDALNDVTSKQFALEQNQFKLQRITGDQIKRYCHICGTELTPLSFDTWMICVHTGRYDHVQ